MPKIFFHGEIHFLDYANKGQNLLGKGNNQSTKQTQKALRALTGIVGLDGHAHLHNAPAENDHANGFDAGEDKIGKVIYNGQRIAVHGKGREAKQGYGQANDYPYGKKGFGKLLHGIPPFRNCFNSCRTSYRQTGLWI